MLLNTKLYQRKTIIFILINDFIHFHRISLTFAFAFGDFKSLLQNLEISDLAMVKVKKINITVA
jgi:hypothetical protein